MFGLDRPKSIPIKMRIRMVTDRVYSITTRVFDFEHNDENMDIFEQVKTKLTGYQETDNGIIFINPDQIEVVEVVKLSNDKEPEFELLK